MEVQKTFKMDGDLVDRVRVAKEDFGYTAEYLVFNDLVRMGLTQLYLSEGRPDDVPPEPEPDRPKLARPGLNRLLDQASTGGPSGFLTIADINALLLHERTLDRLRQAHGDDPFALEMHLNLFRFQFYSKIAYLNYLFTPLELKGFSYRRLIPIDPLDAPHPLLGLLEDISGQINLSEPQQELIKDLLLTYKEDLDETLL